MGAGYVDYARQRLEWAPAGGERAPFAGDDCRPGAAEPQRAERASREVMIEQLRAQLDLLLEQGLIGDFNQVEVVEVIGTQRGARALNVLTVAVLAEGSPADRPADEPEFLTGRIAIDGFRDWSFGVVRVVRPLEALDRALSEYQEAGRWALSGRCLGTGNLVPQPGMFVPPDGTVDVPLNRVLKNNFWAGSHVFRLCDLQKAPLAPFFADRRRLQALSDEVSKAVPMAFAGLADLLGDVLIQIPVMILATAARAPRGADRTHVNVVWREGAKPRALTMAARARWDQVLTGAAVGERFDHDVDLAISSHGEPLETEIWDAKAGILVAASAATSTLKSIQLNFNITEPEPRLFSASEDDGLPVPRRVKVSRTSSSIVGEETGDDVARWLGRRQELEERRRLDASRDFIQYRCTSGSLAERKRALTDLRFLVDMHGHAGVDLWDPYLTGDDLLQTLFWCPHADAPLRALTDGRDPPERSHGPERRTRNFRLPSSDHTRTRQG